LVPNLRHDTWTGRLDTYFTGATIKHFTGKALQRYTIPVPSVPEQNRVLKRVRELMTLCDYLDQKLRLRDAAAMKLAKAFSTEVVG